MLAAEKVDPQLEGRRRRYFQRAGGARAAAARAPSTAWGARKLEVAREAEQDGDAGGRRRRVKGAIQHDGARRARDGDRLGLRGAEAERIARQRVEPELAANARRSCHRCSALGTPAWSAFDNESAGTCALAASKA